VASASCAAVATAAAIAAAAAATAVGAQKGAAQSQPVAVRAVAAKVTQLRPKPGAVWQALLLPGRLMAVVQQMRKAVEA